MACTLCNAFVERGQRVHLVVITKEGEYWPMLSSEVEVFNLNRRSMWLALLPMWRYMRGQRPASLLCFMPAANVVGGLANLLASKPAYTVISERGVYTTSVRWWFDRVQPLFYHMADRMICVSQGVAEDLKRYVALPVHKVQVIYNPTVREEVYRLKDQPVDHRWLAPNQPPVILAVGAFRKVKNYSLLLLAFAELSKTHDARLLMLGEGEERAELEHQALVLGITQKVDMPGFARNPYAYMARAACFVLCSESEGLPNVVIEALACGCPVVATDCPGGVREILEGEYGALVPGDVAKLADALREALDNKQQALARVSAFQKEKLHLFTPEVVIPQYCDALRLQSR